MAEETVASSSELPTEPPLAEITEPVVEECCALVAYLDGLMHDLRANVPIALTQWQVEAIHQSRVATRRMKAAMELVKPIVRQKRRKTLDRVLRKLRRRLAPMRDADVMLEHLGELASGHRHARAVRWLGERLSRERDALRRSSTKSSGPEKVLDKLNAWQPLRQEIQSGGEAIDSLLGESLHLQLEAFAEQADRMTETADSADGDGNAVRQDPHALRIAGKALRYTLELAAVEGHALPHELTKTFKRMQESLGLWHDYVVLADRAMHAAMDDGLGHHDPAAMNEIFELLRDVLARAAKNLSDFKQLWTAQGDAVAKAIRAAFPLTSPMPATIATVTESQTDPGPSC
jgi:CHAD domain-containing protein